MANQIQRSAPTNPFGAINPFQRPIMDESMKFPGITKADENKIMSIARNQAHSEYEENLIANDLYKEALKSQNSKNFSSNRQDAKQDLYKKSLETKDKKQSNKLRTTERTAEVADMIRNYARSNGYGNTLDSWDDVAVINGFTNENKQVRNEIEDYINGDESSFSFSKRMGFGAGSERSRFDMITEDKGERNDDLLGHFETESYENAKGNKVGTWFKNLGKSAYNLVSDLTNMIVNPLDTVSNLGKAAVGGAMNLFGTDEDIKYMKDGKLKDWFESANTVADGMGDFLKNRYGGVDQIANTLYQDPVGLISDIASVVTGGAGLAKGAATATAKTAAKVGAKSTAKTAGKIANIADDVMKAGIKYDPATHIMNAELKATGKAIKGTYQGAKATATAVAHPFDTIKGAYKTVAEGLNNISDRGAEKITKTATAQDKLYKAQEPRMNSLTRNKDLEKKRVNSDRANQLIVENGYKPTDTSSRLLAHEATMRKLWSEVENRINGGEAVQVDQSRLASVLYDYINEQKRLGSSFNEADIAALERELKTLEGNSVDLPTLEKKKQLYNSIINNWGEQKVSDVFANGIKKLTHEIGVIEDSILAEIPGEFQKLKSDFGALADTYEDVFKADMKNQRKKGLGLTETYSRIEGAGDMINGALSIFNGGAKDVIKGASKVLIGKSLAKAKDVDFLVKQGFEELANGYGKGLDKNQVSSKTAKYQKTYHGSKADFDRFDSSHMGEGAGSQAQGWGHYVTKNKDSAKIYAEGDKKITYKGKTVAELKDMVEKGKGGMEQKAAIDVLNSMNRFDSIEEALQKISSIDDEKMSMYKKLDKNDFGKTKGHLYEVEIPDPIKKNTPTGKNYWEHKQIYKGSQVDKILAKAKELFTTEQYKTFSEYVDERNFNGGKMLGEDIYKALDRSLGGQKEASKFLEKLGYDGITYKGGRDGEVYIIFNDEALQITNHEKYQKYGMAKNNEKGMSAKQGLNMENFKNGRTVKQIADRYGIDIKIVDKILTPEGEKALGMYEDGVITLAKKLKESTVPHELLHATFDMVDNTRKTSILEGIKKNLKVDDIQAEEWLADSFSEYYRTGKFGTTGFAKTFTEKVKQFFYEVKKFIDGTYKNEKEIRQLFDDILEGKDFGGSKGNGNAMYMRVNNSSQKYRMSNATAGIGDGNLVNRVNQLAAQFGIKGNNTLDKMIELNRYIKTLPGNRNTNSLINEVYDIKDAIMLEQIKRRNKKLKNYGSNTKFWVRQGKSSIDWHLGDDLKNELRAIGLY